VAVSANGSIAQAVAAMRAGAADYLVKPVSRDRLQAALDLAVTAARATSGLAGAPKAQEDHGLTGFHRFVGGSPAMLEVYRRLRAVAGSAAPVFITGETGVGKELTAAALHELGPRATGPFVALNCGAIPRELMESEVFGHVRGAFTGAIADRPGAARAAHGGTLFLDEICELDPALQTKLLRVVETGMVQPVGSTAAEWVDVRIVCATNRAPLAEVRAGRFREDLYYRLHVLPVHLPPLRMRGDDVLAIARACLARMTREEGKAFERFSADAEQALLAHPWPGNVRELQNVIRQAVVLNDGVAIEAGMLLFAAESPAAGSDHAMLDAIADSAVAPLRALRTELGADLKDLQRSAIERAIAACGGSIPAAARMLGVAPSTVYRKRESWGAASRPC
jgi:two-component system repressor protein LuxO